MATTQRTVEIIFGGVDRTGQAVTSVGRNLDSLSSRVGSLTGPLASITDSILQLDVALVAIGAAALGFATKEAVTFEAALIDLQKVMGEGEGAASDYSDQFSNLASRFGVNAEEIIGSTADFRQAGFNIEESLTLVEQSLLAVNAADLTAAESSELLIGTLAGFKAPAEEAAHLLDVLNGVSNKAGASVSELGDGFRILAPIADTLGLSFEETAALLTPIVEVTRSGSEAANALKTSIANLIKPTAERKALLEDELGIQLELNGERRDTKDVLNELIQKTQGLTDNEKQRVATIIAGAEQMSRFLAILNGAERSEEILQIALQSSGSALEEFEVKTASAEFALKQLQSAFTTAAAAAGSEYLDETTRVTKATTDLVDAFRTAIQGENAGQLFEALGAGLDTFAAQIETIAQNLPEAFEGLDFSDLLASFGDLGDEIGDLFTGLFGEIDLSTVEGLESALQKIVDAVTALVNVSSGIASGLEPLFSALGAGIEQFQNMDEASKKTVGEILGLGKVIDTVLPVVGGLAGGLQSVGTGLTALAGAQGFKAIIGNLDSVKGIAAGAGRYGLVGSALVGAGAAGFGIGTLINEAIIDPLEDLFGTSIGSKLYELFNADEIAEIERQLNGVGDQAKATARETAELKLINDRLTDSLDNTKQAAELDIEALNKRAAELVKNANATTEFTGSQRETTSALDNLTQTVTESGGALADVSRFTQDLAEGNQSLQVSYNESKGKIDSFSGTIVKSGKAVEDTAKKTEEAIKKSEEYQLKLLEIASDERIANIEAKVSLDIAEVEAGAEKVKALSESISEAFASTGDLIGGLFGELGDASGLDQLAIERQIRDENERRDEALKLQKQLTEAEIEQIRERTQSIRRGDSLIKVDGAGLQPHLEAFMFEILNEIQIRVNADGGEQLLGAL